MIFLRQTLSIVGTTTDLLSKFKQLIAHVCEVTYDKDITLVYRLGRKSDDNSRIRPFFVKCSNPSIKTNLIRNAFEFKDSNYSISIGRTKEECNPFKTLLKEKNELEQNEMSE